MEKKKTKIATNLSSGAEKVEKVEKTVKKNADEKRVSTKEKEIDVKKLNAQSTDGKAEKESERAKERVEAAIKKQEEKMKKKAEREARAKKARAEKKARIEKRRAEKKALAEKRAAEKKARIEKRKAEREAMIRERAHAKANERQRKSKERSKKKTERRENRGKGYGGWLAAVIVLGAVTLGLTTALTVGAMEMRDLNNGMMLGNQAATNELVGIAGHLDDDLDRARIASTSEQQSRILTDLLVQARLAEADLEKLPVCAEGSCNLTTFFNRVARESERMLGKLRRGESLTEKDAQILQELYEKSHGVKAQMEEYVSMMPDKDIRDFMKKGEGNFKAFLQRLEDMTLPENGNPMQGIMPRMEGAGKGRETLSPENNTENAITPAQAEELCKRYFADYKIDEYQCIGETVARGYTAYNVQGYDGNGTLLFAELDYQKGELVRFDYFKECEGENFDMQNAQTLADNFLEKLGYDSVTAVRARENGTDIDFTYVYKQDGVVYYPDMLHVKVCRSRGVVTGFDASKYLKNHKTDRGTVKVSLSEEQAKSRLHKGVEVENARLAVVNTMRGERAAYEFVCSYMEERYVIYTDAVSGEEISIINLKNLG